MNLVDRMKWTAAHADHLRTGRQARRWMFVLARRMRAVEQSSDGNAPAVVGEVASVLEEGRRIARRFFAPDPPPHLVAFAELEKKPWGPWEWISWWSGTLKISARWAPRVGVRAAVAAAVAAWRKR